MTKRVYQYLPLLFIILFSCGWEPTDEEVEDLNKLSSDILVFKNANANTLFNSIDSTFHVNDTITFYCKPVKPIDISTIKFKIMDENNSIVDSLCCSLDTISDSIFLIGKFIPNKPINANISISVITTDNQLHDNLYNVTLVISTIPEVNKIPIFTTNKPQEQYSIVEGDTLSFDVIATDENSNDSLTISISSMGKLPHQETVAFSDSTFNWISSEDDSGSYIVTFSASDDDTSIVTSVTINVLESIISPVIITQPLNQNVIENDSVQFSIVATGTSLSYQWKKNSIDINGAVGATYSISNCQLSDSGSIFKCMVYNSADSILSDTALLLVSKKIIAPTITTQPADQNIIAGDSAKFSIVASGTSLSYQWQKNNIDIVGALEATYSISTSLESDSGSSYTCIVFNKEDTITSNSAILHVSKKIIAPFITTQPSDQNVTAGNDAKFTIVATGTSLSYQWQKNSVDIVDAIEATYTISNCLKSDSGSSYSCVVFNSIDTITSEKASLNVSENIIAPSITTQPIDANVNYGENATFTVVAEGTNLSYQWYKGSTEITGATNSSYIFSNASKTDNNQTFNCKISNTKGNVTSSNAKLTVNWLEITKDLEAKTINSGDNGILSISVDANPAVTNYIWYKTGSLISGQNTNELYITSATSANEGFYKVEFTNEKLSQTSSTVEVSVNYIEITTQPETQFALEGETATFSVIAIGKPTLSYQWCKGENDISGATSSTYTTSATTLSDDKSSFKCKISNGISNVTTDVVTLNISSLPIVTLQPEPFFQSAEGDTITLVVTATGYPKPTYQWQKDGVDIIGATDSIYTKPSIITNDEGIYKVVVTNTGGTVTSDISNLDKIYKAANIGSYRWTSENINIEIPQVNGITWGYVDDRPETKEIYGLLYNIIAADSICPKGWHIATFAEYNSLINGSPITKENGGAYLKSKDESIWGAGNIGYDSFNFNILPAGSNSSSGNATGFGTSARFWLKGATWTYFAVGLDDALYGPMPGYMAGPNDQNSCRCVKDY